MSMHQEKHAKLEMVTSHSKKYWELNSSPLEELLATKPSHQPPGISCIQMQTTELNKREKS